MLVPVEDVRKLAESILLANGVPPDHASTQAGLFLEAEMRAIPSHGLLRLRRVIERIRAGLTVGDTSGDSTEPAFSPDGQRLALTLSGSNGNLDIWLLDLASQKSALRGSNRIVLK